MGTSGFILGVVGGVAAVALRLTTAETLLIVPLISGGISIIGAWLHDRRWNSDRSYEDLMQDNERMRNEIRRWHRDP